ncbi:V-type ATP synthase subunit D [Candidatus Omnitrophota bacterium]
MLKIKLTKGELKRQRDALKQFERYLPTLLLKKQQLQLEILHQLTALHEKMALEAKMRNAASGWAGLLAEPGIDIKRWASPQETITGTRNIAGTDIPVFVRAEFKPADYDLFITPLWVDAAVEELKNLAALIQEVRVIKKGIELLRHELRITTQRVNLFEKIKIPEAREAIRLIKIYLGDQMTNAVGRSKIAKRKIEAYQEASLATANS